MRFSPFQISLGLILVFYTGFCVPLLPVAADDIRMVDVFSMDEASAVAVVRYLYVRGTWVVETFSYGGLFYYVPVMILHVLGIFGSVDDLMIVVVLRGIGTLAGVGCVFLTFQIGRIVGGEAAGAIAACLLVLTPAFLRWSVEIHPDIPQMFWLLSALYGCCLLFENRTTRRVAMVGVFAGLAFATKYAGVFLLPVIGLVILLSRGGGVGQLRNRQVWWDCFLAFGAFGGVCVITNFSALLHPQIFFHDVAFERAHLSFGHMFQADRAGLSWVVDLVNLTGWVHGVVGMGAVGWLIWNKRLSNVQVVFLVWGVLFVGYLAGFANLRAARYLLPVLPVGLVFVGVGYCEIGRVLNQRLKMPFYVGGMILGSLVLWHRGATAEALFVEKWHRAEDRDEIAAGRWLGEIYGEETSILYHAYSYVPEKFTQAFRVSALHYLMVNHFEPDVLVVRDALAGRFANIDNADRAQAGRAAFLDRHYFYVYLQAGLLDSYVLKKNFGAVAVYQRAKSKDRRRVKLGWDDRMERWAQGQVFDAVGAFGYMAAVHQSQGEVAEASRLLELAKDAAKGLEAQLEGALALLKQGDVAGAQKMISQIEAAVVSESATQQAAVHLAIGRAFLQTGHMQKAVTRAQRALELNPTYREGHFDLGLFYVAAGDMAMATQAYERAIALYGKDPRALGLLQQFVQGGLAVEGARKMLAVHFGEGTAP